MENMTIEQIEAHLQAANLEQFNKPEMEGVEGAQMDMQGKLQQICGIYKGIKPILQAVMNFPLVPASIKTALRIFSSAMDSICA